MPSSGPNAPSNSRNVLVGGAGYLSWSNTGNALAEDGAFASITGDGVNGNYRLGVYGFGFNIPAGRLDGVVVEAKAKASSAGPGLTLLLGTQIDTDVGGVGAGKWNYPSTSLAWHTYGGAADMWSTTLTPANVNASAFGVQVMVEGGGTWPNGVTMDVDQIRVTIYYTPAALQDRDDEEAGVVRRLSQTRSVMVAGALRVAQFAAATAEFLPFSSPEISRELQWRLGGRVEFDRELQWRLGGTVAQERTLQWRVAPSPLRVHYALTGRSGPVTYAFRFERRTIANQFLQDVTPAFLGGSIEANNDRDVFRTATFTVDANAVDDRGNAVTIDPLADHIAVFMDLLVDGSYTLGLPMGLFALNVPRKRYEPGSETWEITASDNGIHLMEATTTASYTVAAAENYITGANAVRDILDDLGLAHALPTTSLTLPVARTWPAGTPWLRIVNDLLHAAGMYSLWFDASGIARTRAYDDLSTRTPDVTYTGEDFVLIPITEEAETTRLANQVVAVVDDPSRAVLTSVKTNADPDSPISTVTLGRTITRVVNSDAADQATLDAIAENYLRNEAGLYRRGTLLTSIDPRREAREVYELTVDGVYAAERWWARNWRVQLDIGAQQQHTLGKVERVAAS